MPTDVRPRRSSSKSDPTPCCGDVMSTTVSPSTTPTRAPPPGAWNWQSFIARLSSALGQAESTPEDLLARLLVGHLSLRSSLRHWARVTAETRRDRGEFGLLNERPVGEARSLLSSA